MSFEENGYLGESAEIMASEIFQRNKDYFVLCYDLVKYALKIRSEIKADLETNQEIVCVGLFLRIVEGVQTAIILINRGLEYDTWVVIRSIFEAFFFLEKCSNDNNFVEQYVMADFIEFKKIINVALKMSEEEIPEIEGYSLDEIKEDMENFKLYLEEEIDKTSINLKLNREKIARDVGLSDFYDYGYRQASSYTHVSPRSLNRYVKFNQKKSSHSFPMPSDYFAIAHLNGLCGLIIKSIKSICQLFGLERNSDLDIFQERFFKISKHGQVIK